MDKKQLVSFLINRKGTILLLENKTWVVWVTQDNKHYVVDYILMTGCAQVCYTLQYNKGMKIKLTKSLQSKSNEQQ